MNILDALLLFGGAAVILAWSAFLRWIEPQVSKVRDTMADIDKFMEERKDERA